MKRNHPIIYSCYVPRLDGTINGSPRVRFSCDPTALDDKDYHDRELSADARIAFSLCFGDPLDPNRAYKAGKLFSSCMSKDHVRADREVFFRAPLGRPNSLGERDEILLQWLVGQL